MTEPAPQTTASPSKSGAALAATAASSQPIAPPEESIWQRYSPHGEGPLSLAGSIALHTVGVGLLVMIAMWLLPVSFLFVLLAKSSQLPPGPIVLMATLLYLLFRADAFSIGAVRGQPGVGTVSREASGGAAGRL